MPMRTSGQRTNPRWVASCAAAGVILACLLVTSCKQKVTAPPAAGPTQVAFVTVQSERTVLTTELPGRTSAYLVAEIRPQVSGILKSRLFQEGANVNAGDLLYQIEPAPYQATFNQAKATLGATEAELGTAEATIPALRSRAERLKELVAVHAVGQQDYDDAAAALRQAEANLAARKASVEVARAAVETARVNLSFTPIHSPISGRIGISNITVGALATGYQPTPLAVVQQLDPIYVDVAQANADLLRLRERTEKGHLKRNGLTMNRVKLILEDGSIYPITGSLQFRDVTVDPTTGSMTLRLVFRNPNHVLLPGMFVRAVVEEGMSDNALLVPQQGVSRDQKGQAVAMVIGNGEKVEQRVLGLDRAMGDKWLVTSGLAEGDRLIVEGLQKIRPGVPVTAVPFAGSGGGGAAAGGRPPAAQSKTEGGSK